MPQPSRPGASPGTQTVQRAVSLLKAFAAGRPELRLPELAAMAGLNKTTAYRLLTALAHEGLLERLPDGRGYRLGPELLALGSLALAQVPLGAAGLREASHAELQALAYATRETATVEVLAGRDVLVVDEVGGDHVVGSMPSIGARFAAHATSTGKVLLAHLRAPLLEQLLGSPLPAFTPRTLTDPAALRRELARVRERGFALAAEELEPGFLALAAPLFDRNGEVVAAVSVGGPKSRLNQERVKQIVALLPAVAARISRRLGHRPGATTRERPSRRAPARRAAGRR